MTIKLLISACAILLSALGQIAFAQSTQTNSSFAEQPIDVLSLQPILLEKCYETGNYAATKPKSKARVLSERAQALLRPALKVVESMQNAESEEQQAKNNIKELKALIIDWEEAKKTKKLEETDAQFAKRLRGLDSRIKDAHKQIRKDGERAVKANDEYNELLPTGLPKLRVMQSKSDGIKSYDRAIMWNYFAYFAGISEDFPLAKEAFINLLNEEGATDSLRKNGLWQLGVLHLQDEEFDVAFEKLTQWYSLARLLGDKLRPDMFFLLSRSAFAAKNSEKSVEYIMNTFELNSCLGKLPRENWLTSLFDLKNTAQDYEGSLRPLELLLILFPKKRYWLRLQSLYAQKEYTGKQTAVLEIAYQQGFFDKEREYKALGTSLLAKNLPFKAAQVIQEGIDLEVVEKNFANYKLLGDAYRRASEHDLAISNYLNADEFTDDGRTLKAIASLYTVIGDQENALKYYREALEKGDLKQTSFVKLQIGTSMFQLGRLEESLAYFTGLIEEYEQANNENLAERVKPWVNAASARIEYLEKHNERLEKFQKEFDQLAEDNPEVDLSTAALK